MPHIKPFKGIHPHPDYADQVVIHMEGVSIAEAKLIRESTPYSFVNMLVPKLENRFLRGSKKELAYKQINENFEDFLEKGVLIEDELPAVYVYRIMHHGILQTGIWTITSIDDYLDNTIKKHELTRAEREAGLIEYLQQTGMDANPVLITYPPDEVVGRIISDTTKSEPCLNFCKAGEQHWLWKIEKEDAINDVVAAFKNLPATYIADGHHRAAAACTAGIERRKLNLKHTGKEEYNFFTSIYIPANELVIYPFHRLIKSMPVTAGQLLDRLEEHFQVIPAESLLPSQLHEFGMYLDGNHYKLVARAHSWNINHPVEQLDVTILQKYVLSPLMNINDPRTDERISCVGGIEPVNEVVARIDDGTFDVAFFLYPVSVNHLIQVADAGEVMPPKSTCFEPKFLTGLLIHLVS